MTDLHMMQKILHALKLEYTMCGNTHSYRHLFEEYTKATICLSIDMQGSEKRFYYSESKDLMAETCFKWRGSDD